MRQILFLMVFTSIVGCSSFSKSKLLGEWQAVSLIENKKPVKMDFSQVRFAFHSDGSYEYTSTLNHRESGFFDIREHLLLTLDTFNSGSTEKAVEILKLDNDSLIIKMKEGAIERKLTFINIK